MSSDHINFFADKNSNQISNLELNNYFDLNRQPQKEDG
jgi:hypothetical protein